MNKSFCYGAIIIGISIICISTMISAFNKVTTKEIQLSEEKVPVKIDDEKIEIKNEKIELKNMIAEAIKEEERISRGENNNDNSKQVFLHKSIHTPTSGVLTSTFGEKRGESIHKGIDLAAPTGTPIEAAFTGVINYSGVAKGYGKVVIIDHDNGMQTVYAHCNKLYVNTGENINRGQLIAEVGNTGDSTGPHLHFELKINGNTIDPLEYKGDYQY